MIPVFEKIFLHGFSFGVIFHLANVGTCGKGFFASGDDDRANAVICFESVEGFIHLGNHLGVQSIQSLGPVEGDDANGSFGFSQYGFKTHDHSLLACWAIKCGSAGLRDALDDA